MLKKIWALIIIVFVFGGCFSCGFDITGIESVSQELIINPPDSNNYETITQAEITSKTEITTQTIESLNEAITSATSKEETYNSELQELSIPYIPAPKNFDEISDEALINIFKKLIKNYNKYNDIRLSDLLEFDNNDQYDINVSNIEYKRVLNIENMEALKKLVEAVFSEQMRENIIYPNLIKSDISSDYHLFAEHDGKLYYNRNTGGCIYFIIDTDTAIVTNKENNTFYVTATIKMIDTSIEYVYQIINENGYCVMNNDYLYK